MSNTNTRVSWDDILVLIREGNKTSRDFSSEDLKQFEKLLVSNLVTEEQFNAFWPLFNKIITAINYLKTEWSVVSPCPLIHGVLDREQANAIITDTFVKGAFIIRLSISNPGSIAITHVGEERGLFGNVFPCIKQVLVSVHADSVSINSVHYKTLLEAVRAQRELKYVSYNRNLYNLAHFY